MSITQDFRMMTLNLLTDTVTINLEVNTLKGQYMHLPKIITIMKRLSDHGVKTSSQTETFMRIVRETQIEPNRYYLETIMNQSLYNNFATNCHQLKVTVVEQQTLQEDDNNRQTQSPCPSNWSDYLHMADNTDDENMEQTELTY